MSTVQKLKRVAVTAATLLTVALLWQGCGYQPEHLYALKLSETPTEEDWRLSVPLRLEAKGGVTSLPGDADVDDDSVHKATASCHHGSGAPPVQVELRAFYTESDLYVRVTWGDPTEQRGPQWRRSGSRWRADPPPRDGLGVIWGEEGKPFNCATACHLRDWRMAGDRGLADYRMRAPKKAGDTANAADANTLDFWVWRAGRDRPEGSVEDAVLTREGKVGDGPNGANSFERYNSKRAKAATTAGAAPGSTVAGSPFGEWDEPLVTAFSGGNGDLLPGILVADATADRNEIEGRADYAGGRWTLTLRRKLAPLGSEDVTFRPGGQYLLGLAVIDGVALDHNAVPAPTKLILVDKTVTKESSTR
jgi:hypothetical protein